MKRLLVLVLSLALCFPMGILSHGGESGSNEFCDWRYDSETGTLYLSNATLRYDLDPKYFPADAQKARKIVIEDTVEYVSAASARYFTQLEELVIPDGSNVTASSGRFGDAYEANPDNWEDGVLYAGNHVVGYEEGRKQLKVREGTVGIAGFAFYRLDNKHDRSNCIEEITLPDTIWYIGEYAFEHQEKIAYVTLPSQLEVIGTAAFRGCKYLTDIVIPDSVTEIGYAAFENCVALTEIQLGKGVQIIGDRAFYLCIRVKSLTIPEGIEFIGSKAFGDLNRITELTIPAGVKQVGDGAFRHCDSLKSVDFRCTSFEMGTGVFAECVSLSEVKLPDGISGIPNETFKGCVALTGVDLVGVRSIGASAFEGCIALETLDLSTVTYIGAAAFKDCAALTDVGICAAGRVGADAFRKCTALTEIEMPAVTGIGTTAFNGCSSLVSVRMGGNSVSVGNAAFTSCGKLSYLSLPENFTVGNNGFALNNVHAFYRGDQETWNDVKDSYFINCSAVTVHYGCNDVRLSLRNTVVDGVSYTEHVCGVCDEVMYVGGWYSDVPEGAWYYDAVEHVAKNGLFNGVSNTAFDPDAHMTRAMLVTVLWRLNGEPVTEAKHPFTDVKKDSWYGRALDWAYEAGITDGRSPTVFDPNGVITREQMATMLYRYSTYMELDTNAASELGAFPDADAVSAWAFDAVRWSVGAGIIEGNNKGGVLCLDPQGRATRAQVATMLMRFA